MLARHALQSLCRGWVLSRQGQQMSPGCLFPHTPPPPRSHTSSRHDDATRAADTLLSPRTHLSVHVPIPPRLTYRHKGTSRHALTPPRLHPIRLRPPRLRPPRLRPLRLRPPRLHPPRLRPLRLRPPRSTPHPLCQGIIGRLSRSGCVAQAASLRLRRSGCVAPAHSRKSALIILRNSGNESVLASPSVST